MLGKRKRIFKTTIKLYFHTKRSITRPDAWMAYLTTAGRNYKLPFDEQVLIYAQRPDSTAVLPTSTWNRRFGRWVNRGSVGIAVLDKQEIGRLKYYFDISDTHPSRYARLVPLWEVRPEFQANAIAALDIQFGPFREKTSLASAILASVDAVTQEHFDHYWEQLLQVRGDSDLADVPEDILRSTYWDLIELSAAYCVMRRCGVDTGPYIDASDFRGIEQFSTLEATNALGIPTAVIAGKLLDSIALEIKPLYRIWQLQQHTVERSNTDGRTGDDGARGQRSDNPVQPGVGPGRQRAHFKRLPRGCTGALPLLLLWGCDVDLLILYGE